MYVTNPMLFKIYQSMSEIVVHIISITLFIIFIVDNIISSNIISSVNVEGSKLVKDNTEEITEKVKQILREKSWLHRRLINAYPNLKDIRVKIKQVKEKVKDRRKNQK